MKHLKRILIVFTGGLIAFNTIAADAPDRPLHVLYLGSVSAGGGGGGFGGFGGSRTNYVYLPVAEQTGGKVSVRHGLAGGLNGPGLDEMICFRLFHKLPTELRQLIIAELCRVSRHYVLLS